MTEQATTVSPSSGQPPPPARWSRGRVRVVVAAIVVVVVLLGGLYAGRAWPFSGITRQEQVEFVASDGTKVTVRARVVGGRLKVVPLEQSALPTTWRALGTPVQIETEGLEGLIGVEITPPEGALNGVENEGDVDIVCRTDDLGAIPLGSQRRDDGAFAVETSCTNVVVAQPEKTTLATAGGRTLSVEGPAPKDPVAAALLRAPKGDPGCPMGSSVVLGVAGGNDSAPVCIEYDFAAQNYRMSLSNWADLPYAYRPADGVTFNLPQEPAESLLPYLRGPRRSGVVMVGAHGNIEGRYPGSAARPGASLVGLPDVEGWVLYGLRESLLTTFGAKERPAGAAAAVDRAVVRPSVTECAEKAAAELSVDSTRADVLATGKKGVADCLPVAARSLAESYSALTGSPTEGIEQRVRRLLAIAGDHVARVDRAWSQLVYKPPPPVEIAPTTRPVTTKVTDVIPLRRFMTKDEVFAVSVTAPRGDWDKSRCPAPPPWGEAVPLGVDREATCFYSMEADLDGNGVTDRGVFWNVSGPFETGTGNRVKRWGGAAYLDDGRMLPLSGESSEWKLFEPTRPVYLANNRRQQILVYTLAGAHTLWSEIMTVNAAGEFTSVRRTAPGWAALFVDSALMSAGDFGCYTRDGIGRIAKWSWSADSPSSRQGVAQPGRLRVSPYQLDDDQLVPAADPLVYATSDRPKLQDSAVGQDCTVADPAARGAFAVRVPGARPVPGTPQD